MQRRFKESVYGNMLGLVSYAPATAVSQMQQGGNDVSALHRTAMLSKQKLAHADQFLPFIRIIYLADIVLSQETDVE